MYFGSFWGDDVKPTLYTFYIIMKISAKGEMSSVLHFNFRKDIVLLPFFIAIQKGIPNGGILP